MEERVSKPLPAVGELRAQEAGTGRLMHNVVRKLSGQEEDGARSMGID